MDFLPLTAITKEPKLRTFLSKMLEDELVDEDIQRYAADILARSSLPQAAEILVERGSNLELIQDYISNLGDIAVPSLADNIMEDEVWKLDSLHTIGTSESAKALANCLWQTDNIARHAAWCLASIFTETDIEKALNSIEITEEQKKCKQIDWIWEPFLQAEHNAFEIIVGRMAYLMHTTPANLLPQTHDFTLDPRLIIPLCAIVQNTKLRKVDKETLKEFRAQQNNIHSVETLDQIDSSEPSIIQFNQDATNALSSDHNWQYMIKTLPSTICFNLLSRLMFTPVTPTENDWRTLFQKVEYQFNGSWQAITIKSLCIIILLLGLWEQAETVANVTGNSLWLNMLAIVCGILSIISISKLLRENIEIESYILMSIFFGFTIGAVAGGWLGMNVGNMLIVVIGIIIGSAASGFVVGAMSGVINVEIVVATGVAIGGTLGGIVGWSIGGEVGGIIGVVIGVAIISAIGGEVGVAVSLVIGFASVFWATVKLINFWPLSNAAQMWVIWLLIFFGILIYAKRRERRAQNPLHGLVDAQEQTHLERPRKLLPKLGAWPLFRNV